MKLRLGSAAAAARPRLFASALLQRVCAAMIHGIILACCIHYYLDQWPFRVIFVISWYSKVTVRRDISCKTP